MEGFDALIDTYVEYFNRKVQSMSWNEGRVGILNVWGTDTERDALLVRIKQAGYYVERHPYGECYSAYLEHPKKPEIPKFLKTILEATSVITGYRK